MNKSQRPSPSLRIRCLPPSSLASTLASPALIMRGRRVLAILHNAQPCSAMALAQRSAITQIASRGQAGGARHRSTRAYEIDPSRVTITQGADGVAEVRLSRPDKMNALDLPMFRSIAAAARRLLADRSVRAVVLHGEGRAFCAGLDVKSVAVSLQAQANLKELLDRPEGEISKRVRAARTQASRSTTAAPRAASWPLRRPPAPLRSAWQPCAGRWLPLATGTRARHRGHARRLPGRWPPDRAWRRPARRRACLPLLGDASRVVRAVLGLGLSA